MLNSLFRYYEFISWVIKNSILKNKWLAFIILITAILGVIFQITIFAQIIVFARHFADGESIFFLGHSFNPRESMQLLVMFSFSIGVLLIFSSTCIYASNKYTLQLGRKFEIYCSSHILYLLSTNCHLTIPAEQIPERDKYMLRLVRGDSTWGNRFVINLMSIVAPAVTLLAAMAALFYLEVVLTLILLVLISFFGIIQYQINRKATTYTRSYEKYSPLAAQELRNLIRLIKQQFHQYINQGLIIGTFIKGPVKKQLDAFVGRYIIVEKSKLASGFFLAIILGLTLSVLGAEIIQGGSGWGRLLVYIIAMRFALISLQSLFAVITSISRYYPQVSRIFLFSKSMEGKKITKKPPPSEYGLKVQKPHLNNSFKYFKISNGMRLALVTPISLNRYTLTQHMELLLGSSDMTFYDAMHSVSFVTRNHSSPGVSLREILNTHSVSSFTDLKKIFPNETLWSYAKENLPEDIDENISENTWSNINPNLKFALSLISAANSDHQWVFIEENSLRQLDRDSVSFYLNLLQEKITVIQFNKNLNWVGRYDEDCVVVSDEKKTTGLGSILWFKDIIKTVPNLLEVQNNENIIPEMTDDE